MCETPRVSLSRRNSRVGLKEIFPWEAKKNNSIQFLEQEEEIHEDKENSRTGEKLLIGDPYGEEGRPNKGMSTSKRAQSFLKTTEETEENEQVNNINDELAGLLRELRQVTEKSRLLDLKIAELSKENRRLLFALERRKTKGR